MPRMTAVSSTCWIGVLASLFMLKALTTSKEDSCRVSLPTLTHVPSCPINSVDLQDATKLKKCETIAEIQNCTERSNFVYHCVPLMNLSGLVEICASAIISQGKCIGFDIVGQRLQQFQQRPCQNFNPPCPVGFRSWNSTSYAQCYELKKNPEETVTDSYNMLIILAVVVVILIITVPVLSVYCFKKGRRGARNVLKENLEEGEAEELKENLTRNSSDVQPGTHGNCFTDEGCPETLETDLESINEVFVVKTEETEGFDFKTFQKVIAKYELQSMEDIFKRNDIDCIKTFMQLSDADLEDLKLTIGQKKKCITVINILRTSNKKCVSANIIHNKSKTSSEMKAYSTITI